MITLIFADRPMGSRSRSNVWRTLWRSSWTDGLVRAVTRVDDAPVQHTVAKGKEGVPDDRIAQVAIDFISFCFTRRAVEWPLLYDEMCYVASNKLYRGLGYEELREVGLDLTLGGLVRTSRIANEVTRDMRMGHSPMRGGLVAAV
jgi:hypothetical protein